MLANQDRVHSVQQILRVLFGVVPIVAGADMSASAYSLATLSRIHQEQSGTNFKQAAARTMPA